MSTITAAEVKKLRDSTGAGMMDAKRALTEAEGDFNRAVEVLRVSGQAKAAKRGAERSATNGLVASSDGALLQLGAETDFVAKNEEFQRLAADAVQAVAASRADSVEAAKAAPLPSGQTVADAVEELAVRIGEKLEVSAAAYFDGPTVAYLHRRASDLPPQVGVLVEYNGADQAAARPGDLREAFRHHPVADLEGRGIGRAFGRHLPPGLHLRRGEDEAVGNLHRHARRGPVLAAMEGAEVELRWSTGRCRARQQGHVGLGGGGEGERQQKG